MHEDEEELVGEVEDESKLESIWIKCRQSISLATTAVTIVSCKTHQLDRLLNAIICMNYRHFKIQYGVSKQKSLDSCYFKTDHCVW